MVHTCQIIGLERNEWSDYVEDSSTDQLCHFRQISNIRRITQGEDLDADAMVWFPHDANIELGSIVSFEGLTYQVERFTRARRLGDSQVQFLKCDLKITDVT